MSIFSSSEEEKEKEAKEDDQDWIKPEGQLVIDLYETDDYLFLESPIAGVNLDEIEIYLEDDLLTIKGERKRKDGEEKRNYFIQECYWGPFSREVILPVEVDNQRAEAEVENGILRIKIPKLQREKRRKLKITKKANNKKVNRNKK